MDVFKQVINDNKGKILNLYSELSNEIDTLSTNDICCHSKSFSRTIKLKDNSYKFSVKLDPYESMVSNTVDINATVSITFKNRAVARRRERRCSQSELIIMLDKVAEEAELSINGVSNLVEAINSSEFNDTFIKSVVVSSSSYPYSSFYKSILRLNIPVEFKSDLDTEWLKGLFSVKNEKEFIEYAVKTFKNPTKSAIYVLKVMMSYVEVRLNGKDHILVYRLNSRGSGALPKLYNLDTKELITDYDIISKIVVKLSILV